MVMTMEQLERYVVSEVENLHLKVDSMFDRVLSEIAALHERFNRSDRLLNDRVDAVEFRMDNLEVRLGNLERRVDSIEVRLGNLEMRFDALEVRFGRFEERVDAIEVRLGNLEERVDVIEVRLGKIEVRLGSLEENMVKGFAAVSKQLGLITATQVQILARLDNPDQWVRALA